MKDTHIQQEMYDAIAEERQETGCSHNDEDGGNWYIHTIIYTLYL